MNSSVLTQLGPSIPSLDPSISGFTQFQHQTIPQSNTLLSGTQSLVIDSRTVQVSYSQATDFGLSGTASFSSQRQKVNSAFFSLNPYTNANLDVSLTQNLLNGFGRPVNTRNIRVQKNNLKVTDLRVQATGDHHGQRGPEPLLGFGRLQ